MASPIERNAPVADVLRRFRIVRELGDENINAHAYLVVDAADPLLGGFYVLKVVGGRMRFSEGLIETMSLLKASADVERWPNLPRIHWWNAACYDRPAAGLTQWYMLTDYYDGGTLKHWLREATDPAAPQPVCRQDDYRSLVLQMLLAIAPLQRAPLQLAHRDAHWSNLLSQRTEGRPGTYWRYRVPLQAGGGFREVLVPDRGRRWLLWDFGEARWQATWSERMADVELMLSLIYWAPQEEWKDRRRKTISVAEEISLREAVWRARNRGRTTGVPAIDVLHELLDGDDEGRWTYVAASEAQIVGDYSLPAW